MLGLHEVRPYDYPTVKGVQAVLDTPGREGYKSFVAVADDYAKGGRFVVVREQPSEGVSNPKPAQWYPLGEHPEKYNAVVEYLLERL